MAFHVPEKHRLTEGPMGSDKSYGNNGVFIFPLPGRNYIVQCIASDEYQWDHVSVTLRGKKRTLTWPEMCVIKDTFWDKDDLVVQYHPPESEYVNNHPYCLHLWRYQGVMPAPPSVMVGYKHLNLN